VGKPRWSMLYIGCRVSQEDEDVVPCALRVLSQLTCSSSAQHADDGCLQMSSVPALCS
jgi:hypothetical protein